MSNYGTLRTILLDNDGVLTDGKQYISERGDKMFKAYHSRDIRAIRRFANMGIAVIILTADEWAGAKYWAQRVGAALVPGIRDKKAWAINEGLKASETLVIGDDAWDVDLLKWARWKFCPNDSDTSVFRVPGIEILGFNGGQAVVAEVLNILREQGLK